MTTTAVAETNGHGPMPVAEPAQKMVLVPAALVTTTVRYLAARPYAEVAQLVPALLACKEAP